MPIIVWDYRADCVSCVPTADSAGPKNKSD